MTSTSPGGTGPAGGPARRAAGLPGPEAIGMLASLAVIVLLGAVVLPGVAGSGSSPLGPSPSVSVSGPIIEPSATPASTRPAWAGDAGALLDVDARLLELADGLSGQLDPSPSRADDIARALRSINTRLAFALEAIGRLEAAGMPADLADALREAHATALTASQATLRASVSNVAAYVEGGAAVVEALTLVEALQVELTRESGVNPTP